MLDFLRQRGFTNPETTLILRRVKHRPGTLLEFMAAYELRIGRAQETNPVSRSI